jgi:hypothetical protein
MEQNQRQGIDPANKSFNASQPFLARKTVAIVPASGFSAATTKLVPIHRALCDGWM